MNGKVLIVDDDPAIRKLLTKIVNSIDLSPSTASCGKEAMERLSNETFDLILLDIMLGDMEGFEVIQWIRQNGNLTPVIIVSGRNEDFDYLYGLSLGADDYMTKPFRPQILGAKIKALIRRSTIFAKESDHLLTCGDFVYDASLMRVSYCGNYLDLSGKELSLLLLFLKHPNHIFTREMIYEHVWDSASAVDDNTIMVYINRLRKKLEINGKTEKHIITIRGLGYRFIP